MAFRSQTLPGRLALDLRGIPRALATSTVREEAMARMGPLFSRMHAAAFGDEVANGKPAPDIYRLAVERLGMAADRCLALEDSLPGVESAQRAGFTVIMVPDLVPSHDGIRYFCGSLLSVRDRLAARGVCTSPALTADTSLSTFAQMA